MAEARLELGPQAAVVVIDPRTRDVLAMVGGYERTLWLQPRDSRGQAAGEHLQALRIRAGDPHPRLYSSVDRDGRAGGL